MLAVFATAPLKYKLCRGFALEDSQGNNIRGIILNCELELLKIYKQSSLDLARHFKEVSVHSRSHVEGYKNHFFFLKRRSG